MFCQTNFFIIYIELKFYWVSSISMTIEHQNPIEDEDWRCVKLFEWTLIYSTFLHSNKSFNTTPVD